MNPLAALVGTLLGLAVTTIPSPVAIAQEPVASSSATPASGIGRAKRDWWTANRWRYPDDEIAEAAYRSLEGRQSPWPEWHQSRVVVLATGTRFQMALAPGQSVDRPGAFGTFDNILDVEFVRATLAVKLDWKPEIDRVVTYEITSPLIADIGTVGPQVDLRADRYLSGGASQFQMLVPASERMSHFKVVNVRAIR